MNKILSQTYLGNNASQVLYTSPSGKEVAIYTILIKDLKAGTQGEHDLKKYSFHIVEKGGTPSNENIIENKSIKDIRYIGLNGGDYVYCSTIVGNINIQMFGEEKDISIDDDYKNAMISLSNYITGTLGPNQILVNDKIRGCPC